MIAQIQLSMGQSGLVAVGSGARANEPVSNLPRIVSPLTRRHEVLLGAEQITRRCMPKTHAEELFSTDVG
jgi:hypothetical protein